MQRNNSYDSHFRFKQPILTQNLPLKDVDHHPGHYFFYLSIKGDPSPSKAKRNHRRIGSMSLCVNVKFSFNTISWKKLTSTVGMWWAWLLKNLSYLTTVSKNWKKRTCHTNLKLAIWKSERVSERNCWKVSQEYLSIYPGNCNEHASHSGVVHVSWNTP